MTAAQRKKFKAKLEALQRALQTSQPTEIAPSRAGDSDTGPDEDAQPLVEMLQSIASGRNATQARVAALVARALAKLRDAPDDFGACEDCGDDVAPARLDAMPYVEFCVACQSAHDGPKGLPTRRKITDYR